jgi:hypothetical protein
MSESNSRKFSKGEIGQLITGDVDFTSATVRGHIIPDTNDTYDIGSAEYKIRDAYISDNSLWIGDNVKIGASGGKKKNNKRKKGKTPKKIFDALIGSGKAFANETALKDKFKEEIHDPAPDNTLDPGHADFNPSIKKWLDFSALHGQSGFKRPDDIFDDDDDFDSEDGVDAVEGLQAALDAKLNASLAYALPTATDSILGGVKVGNNLTISNGVLSGVNSYTLPTASSTVLGGIKVGANLSISSGVLAGAAPYSKPSAEPISYITGLQGALDAKVDDSQVLTNVPSGALFTDTNTQLSTEQVQDIIGGMLTGNTETNIAVTYQDSDGTIDFVSTDTVYSKPSAEPISYITGLQGALDAKTTPGYVDTQVAALVDSAPGTLDTLNELAEALGDDANFSTTVTNSIATKLSLSGGTMTGSTIHNDNVKSIYGTSSDGLEIYHDGSNSHVSDTGTGNLHLRGSNYVILESASGEDYIQCNKNGAVQLMYDNAEKVKTTTTGIDVTGTISYDKIRTKQEFTATANQTVFTGPSYKAVDHLDVYLNGVMLSSSDYTSTANTNSITLSSGASVNDIVTMIAWA